MSDHLQFKYRLIGNDNPKGRPYVFFCCHPNDFTLYFDTICNEIWEILPSTVIWYYDENKEFDSDTRERYFSNLKRMNLFVIPVTYNFVCTENFERLQEFSFAQTENIPILPLIQEYGIGPVFNKVCGDYQYLDKKSKERDSTAVDYKIKLKNYILSVLTNDETSQKIRDSFKAYIFLSYRKIDRKYAQEIMELIHKNSFCRDIAIWYDEYLVPGKNFRESIKEAFEKSSLFSLVVTPSILEIKDGKKNFVMNEEYPMAKKAGTKIIPIEAVNTDKDKLEKYYSEIEEPIKITQETLLIEKILETLDDVLMLNNIPIENCNDPEHLFFIGLAYMSGIDVEINAKKGIELLSLAAQGGVKEAFDKLISIYKNGDGVSIDYYQAIYWAEKLLAWSEENYKTEEKAKRAYFHLREEELPFLYSRLGESLVKENKYQEAFDYFKKCSQLRLEVDAYLDTFNSHKDLANARASIGLIYTLENKLAETKECYAGIIELRELVVDEFDSIPKMIDLSNAYTIMSLLQTIDGNYDEANEYHKKCEALCVTIELEKKKQPTVNWRELMNKTDVRIIEILEEKLKKL